MEIVEVLPVNEEVEHVVALPADLQTDFHPIQAGRLKKCKCHQPALKFKDMLDYLKEFRCLE